MSGYTHKITYKQYNDFLGMVVDGYFRTTADMVENHVSNLKHNSKVLSESITVIVL
jgi:hypothetical protein